MVWSSLSVVGRSRAEEGCGQEKSILCACGGRNETVPRSAGSDQSKKESQRERGRNTLFAAARSINNYSLGGKGSSALVSLHRPPKTPGNTANPHLRQE